MALLRTALVEADFLNNIIIVGGTTYEQDQEPDIVNKVSVPEEIAARFLTELVDPFWHTDKDQLEYIIIYNDQTYICQRKKLKYDFKQNVNYWSTYNFTGANPDQVNALLKKIQSLVVSIKEYKLSSYDVVLQKIDQEHIYFDQRYLKKLREKQMMLAATDWRVLPDVEDSYAGEKDMWIKWRSTMRTETVKKPEEFENNLEFLKYIYDHKWPIDPKIYKQKYPEADVEYLSTDDQWVKYDTEASTDFVDTRLINMMNISGVYREKLVKIRKDVYDMMKDLRLEDFAEIDYSRYEVIDE